MVVQIMTFPKSGQHVNMPMNPSGLLFILLNPKTTCLIIGAVILEVDGVIPEARLLNA
jgi:hypothetical protein